MERYSDGDPAQDCPQKYSFRGTNYVSCPKSAKSFHAPTNATIWSKSNTHTTTATAKGSCTTTRDFTLG